MTRDLKNSPGGGQIPDLQNPQIFPPSGTDSRKPRRHNRRIWRLQSNSTCRLTSATANCCFSDNSRSTTSTTRFAFWVEGIRSTTLKDSVVDQVFRRAVHIAFPRAE